MVGPQQHARQPFTHPPISPPAILSNSQPAGAVSPRRFAATRSHNCAPQSCHRGAASSRSERSARDQQRQLRQDRVGDRLGAAIPTIAESGLPGYEAAISYGIFLPAGASPSLVERLHAAVDATIRSPEVTRKFIELGADPQFGTPAQFAAYVADDYAKWARLAKEAGLKIE